MSFDMSVEDVEEGAEDEGFYHLSLLAMRWMLDVMTNAGLVSTDDIELEAPPPDLEAKEPLLSAICSYAEEIHGQLEEFLADDFSTEAGIAQHLRKMMPDFVSEEEISDYLGFDARVQAALAFRVGEGKVSAAKFSTNEGWHVVPEECEWIASGLKKAIAEQGESLMPTVAPSLEEVLDGELLGMPVVGGHFELPDFEDGRDWVLEFAEFNAFAASRGGYRVG